MHLLIVYYPDEPYSQSETKHPAMFNLLCFIQSFVGCTFDILPIFLISEFLV